MKPRTKFGETTFGNCTTFTIDGQQNFKMMYEKMRQAKSSIYIANYDLDPDLQLIRGDTQSFQISDLVTSPCLSESSITYESNNGSFNSSLHNDGDKKYHTLQNLLEKAKQKVDIKIIVWEPRSIIRKLPGIKKRGLEGREKKVEAIKKAAKYYGVEDHLTIRLDSKAPSLTSGFHEKLP